jgi:hypothetical protein
MPAADLVVEVQQLRQLFFSYQIFLLGNLQDSGTNLALVDPVVSRQ